MFRFFCNSTALSAVQTVVCVRVSQKTDFWKSFPCDVTRTWISLGTASRIRANPSCGNRSSAAIQSSSALLFRLFVSSSPHLPKLHPERNLVAHKSVRHLEEPSLLLARLVDEQYCRAPSSHARFVNGHKKLLPCTQ